MSDKHIPHINQRLESIGCTDATAMKLVMHDDQTFSMAGCVDANRRLDMIIKELSGPLTWRNEWGPDSPHSYDQAVIRAYRKREEKVLRIAKGESDE